ncbi:hypothetical protein MTR_7g026145 [Medicago truncatula]|uniref:Uncharacterized protein n=1 Tax=Medicago truncatula TaxID=3880 RepID=A0A072TYK7_MEDTR|nr:hypothetical protein MTR_7g026145 [Medicago truncatula]
MAKKYKSAIGIDLVFKFLKTNNESIEALKSLLMQKLEVGEDEEALKSSKP